MCNKLVNEKFIEQANNIHNNKYCYDEVDYKSSKSYIIITCSKHGNFNQRPDHHLNGSGCQKCGIESRTEIRKKTIEIFINDSKKIHNDKYDYSKSNYINSKKSIEIGCYIHGTFKQTPDNHIQGKGCPKCANKNKTTKEIILEFQLIHDNVYNYSLVEYKSAFEKVKIICCNHGEFLQTPDSHKSGNGCPKCNISKGELQIEKFLIKNNIEFIRQHKFNGCKHKQSLLFDFYLPKYNLCIEYNGKQHYEPIKYFGGEETFRLQKLRDELKRKYCKNNSINLLEIKYNQNIDNTLNIIMR